LVKHWLFPDIEEPENEHLRRHLIHHHPPFISQFYKPPQPETEHWVFPDLPPKKPITFGSNVQSIALSVVASLTAMAIWFNFGNKITEAIATRRKYQL